MHLASRIHGTVYGNGAAHVAHRELGRLNCACRRQGCVVPIGEGQLEDALLDAGLARAWAVVNVAGARDHDLARACSCVRKN